MNHGFVTINLGRGASLSLEHFGERTASFDAENNNERVTGYLDPDDAGRLRTFLDEAFPEHAPQPTGHWTTQPPTEPGWYWFKGGSGEVDVVEVWLPKGGTTLLASDSNATYEPASMEGTWYSEPLSVPGPNK